MDALGRHPFKTVAEHSFSPRDQIGWSFLPWPIHSFCLRFQSLIYLFEKTVYDNCLFSSKQKGFLVPDPFRVETCLAVQGTKGVEWWGVSGRAAQNGAKETMIWAPSPQPKDQYFGKIKDLLMLIMLVFWWVSLWRTYFVVFKSFSSAQPPNRFYSCDVESYWEQLDHPELKSHVSPV